MGTREDAPDLMIASIGRAMHTADGSDLLLEAEGLLKGERRALAIAVKTELAPLVAVTMLAALSGAEPKGDRDAGTPAQPSMLCLAAGIVKSSDPSLLRMHLQFDSGLVLPVEMPRDSAGALLRGLANELGAAEEDDGKSDAKDGAASRSRLG